MVSEKLALTFDGGNWEDLDRLVALARFAFLQDTDYDEDMPRRCAYLAQQFTGPALDWAVNTLNTNAVAMDDFDGYIVGLKQSFGVEDANINALRRKALDDLHWTSHVPTFFAEFDRLTLQMGITGNPTKIAMVTSKLPTSVRALLAQQALDFTNYDTMRERLITMWALDPARHGGENKTQKDNKRPRCGTCGKRGHTATTCRSSSKN